MIKHSAIFDDIKELKDGSCKFVFETQELNEEQFIKARRLKGLTGWLVFGENEGEIDLPPEKAEVGRKTQSQRLRNLLGLLWSQSDKSMTQEEFYQQYMEKVITQFKKLIVD